MRGTFNNTPPTGTPPSGPAPKGRNPINRRSRPTAAGDKRPCHPADGTSANPVDNSHGVTTDNKRVRKFTETMQVPGLTTQSKMKKNIVILTLFLLLAMAAKAQIFTMENEVNELRDPVPFEWVTNPVEYNQGYDVYTPIGEGIALLAALGGAYLLKKRKRE